MTVARLKAEMPSSELVAWMAYYKVKAEKEEQHRLVRQAEAGMQKERTRKIGGKRHS
jgi:hypothetical protein